MASAATLVQPLFIGASSPPGKPSARRNTRSTTGAPKNGPGTTTRRPPKRSQTHDPAFLALESSTIRALEATGHGLRPSARLRPAETVPGASGSEGGRRVSRTRRVHGERPALDPTLGLFTDAPAWPEHGAVGTAGLGAPVVGPYGLLDHVETRLGLAAPPAPAVVRIAAWQARLESVATPERFWDASLGADAWATARLLLGGATAWSKPGGTPTPRSPSPCTLTFRQTTRVKNAQPPCSSDSGSCPPGESRHRCLAPLRGRGAYVSSSSSSDDGAAEGVSRDMGPRRRRGARPLFCMDPARVPLGTDLGRR